MCKQLVLSDHYSSIQSSTPAISNSVHNVVKRCREDMISPSEQGLQAANKRRRVSFQTTENQHIVPSSSNLSLSKDELKETCWLSTVEYQTIRTNVFSTVANFHRITSQEQQQQQQQRKNHEICEDEVCIRGIEHYISDVDSKARYRNRSIHRRTQILKFRLQQLQKQQLEEYKLSISPSSFECKIESVFGTTENAEAIIRECCSEQEKLQAASVEKAHLMALHDEAEACAIHFIGSIA